MSLHAPISDFHAKAIAFTIAHPGQGSKLGSQLDRAAVLFLTPELDSNGYNLPRSFARPTEPVYGSRAQQYRESDLTDAVIGYRDAVTAQHGPETKSEPPQEVYEPDETESIMRAVVSRREDLMRQAGLHDELLTLHTYFGDPGDEYDRGSTDEKGTTTGRLPRLWSLLHLTEAGRELLELEAKLRAEEERKAKERALARAELAASRKVRKVKPVEEQGEPEPEEIYEHSSLYNPWQRRAEGCSLKMIARLIGIDLTRLGEDDDEDELDAEEPRAAGPWLPDHERMRQLCFVINRERYKDLQVLFHQAKLQARDRFLAAAYAWNAANQAEMKGGG